MRRLVTAFAAAAAGVGAPTAQGGGVGSFTPLGRLPGGSQPFSGAYGLSGDGLVAVGLSNSTPGYQGFRWSAGSGMVGYSDLVGSVFDSSNEDVNSNGTVVVGHATGVQGHQAVRWTGTSSFSVTLLGDLPGGSFSSDAWGVSSDGNTVVGVSSSTSGYQAYRWRGGTMSPLGYLGQGSDGAFYSSAQACSGDGETLVGWSTSSLGSQAFRWTSGGGMVGLGDLAGGAFTSTAEGISRDGSTIVGYGTTERGGEACIWRNGLGPVALAGQPDPAPGVTLQSSARAASADGRVIVGSATGILGTPAGAGAFVWTQETGMLPLQTILTQMGVDLTAWTLVEATSVSDDGRVIAGLGWNVLATGGPGYEAFVAVIPAPTTVIALAAPAAFAGLVRRRRRPVSR